MTPPEKANQKIKELEHKLSISIAKTAQLVEGNVELKEDLDEFTEARQNLVTALEVIADGNEISERTRSGIWRVIKHNTP